MKYIIMADGKGTRWNNSNGCPKHLLKIDGENLLERIVRQIKEIDESSEIIITSHNKEYDVAGAKRYQPINNHYEIDRFTYELIENDVCFLYGDTFYSDNAIKTIISEDLDELTFFGNEKSIIGVKCRNGKEMKKCIDKVKQLYILKEISKCIGWQLYQCYMGYEFEVNIPKENFIIINDKTTNINKHTDYINLIENRNGN